jgi:uncharacterized membrane protein
MKANYHNTQYNYSQGADQPIVGVIALVMIFALGMTFGFMISILFFTLAF